MDVRPFDKPALSLPTGPVRTAKLAINAKEWDHQLDVLKPFVVRPLT